MSYSYNQCQRNNYSYASAPIERKCVLLVIVGLVVPILLVCIILASVLGGVLAPKPPASTDVPVFYSPGDTRIVFGNSFFCSEATLEVNSTRSGASAYLITDTPPLTHRNSFSFTSELSIRPYRYWNYYLYPGSTFTTTVRVLPGSSCSGRFSLIKGRGNFQQWIPARLSRGSLIALDSFSIPRTSGFTEQYTFQVQDEDEYYFVYESSTSRGCTFSLTGSSALLLQVSISVDRLLYSTAGLTNAPRCSAVTGGQCSLDVPADSNYRALIVTDLPTNNNPDWNENIDISFYCSSTRGWAYAVVVLVPLLVVAGVTITTVILLVVCWRKRDSLRATCCRQHNTQTTTTEAASTSAVQLQEMGSQGPQQPTADQKDNKTTSDSQKNGQQHHLTAAPPPSYKDSLDYPAQKTDLPPPYNSKEK